MDLKTMLRDLCTAPGVNGCTTASEVAVRLLSSFTSDIHQDRMGNVWGVIPAQNPTAPVLLLEAHIDEIGFVVTDIDERGFLRVAACGGVDNRALTAAPITVLSEPPCNGVFCAIPPHVAKKDAPLPELTDRGVDIGMTQEEAKARIPLGTRAVLSASFEELIGDRISSKALDDRAGVAAILHALSLLNGKTLPFTLVVSFCVQEELGMRGSRTAAYAIQPDAALVVDVSFAHTPDADKRCCGTLGKGAMLGVSPVLDTGMTNSIETLAGQRGIAFQHEVMGGATGTDADVISLTGEGIPTALLSIPLRYMHTPVEVVALSDVESVAALIAAFAEEGEVPIYA